MASSIIGLILRNLFKCEPCSIFRYDLSRVEMLVWKKIYRKNELQSDLNRVRDALLASLRSEIFYTHPLHIGYAQI